MSVLANAKRPWSLDTSDLDVHRISHFGCGCRPEAQGSSLYPNEVASDFAFIPFGGGMRKCVGDQFALLEATAAMAMLLRWVQYISALQLNTDPPCYMEHQY